MSAFTTATATGSPPTKSFIMQARVVCKDQRNQNYQTFRFPNINNMRFDQKSRVHREACFQEGTTNTQHVTNGHYTLQTEVAQGPIQLKIKYIFVNRTHLEYVCVLFVSMFVCIFIPSLTHHPASLSHQTFKIYCSAVKWSPFLILHSENGAQRCFFQ